MKVIIRLVGIILIFLSLGCKQSSIPSGSSTDYFGQKPPGMTPEVFAPGIVTTEAYEHGSPVFSKDLKEIYWTVNMEENEAFVTRLTFAMRERNGKWHKPEIAKVLKDPALLKSLSESAKPADGEAKEGE